VRTVTLLYAPLDVTVEIRVTGLLRNSASRALLQRTFFEIGSSRCETICRLEAPDGSKRIAKNKNFSGNLTDFLSKEQVERGPEGCDFICLSARSLQVLEETQSVSPVTCSTSYRVR
jgi:hypothetical protein